MAMDSPLMLLNDPFHRTLSHSLPLPISPAGGVCEGERWSLMIFFMANDLCAIRLANGVMWS